MRKKERLSSFPKKINNKIILDFEGYDNNKNKQSNLPRILTGKKNGIQLLKGNNEGKIDNNKQSFTIRPITSETLDKNKDVRKKSNIKLKLITDVDKKIKKDNFFGSLTFNNQIFNKGKDLKVSAQKESKENLEEIVEKLKKDNEENKIKIKKLEDEFYNKENEKYNINYLLNDMEDLKQEINIIKENSGNNEDLENLKYQNEIMSLILSEIRLNHQYNNGKELKPTISQEINKKLKENPELINLFQKENISKEKDEIEKIKKVNDVIDRNRRIKSSNFQKMPFNEELKRNKSLDIEKSRFDQDTLNLKNKKNEDGLLKTENNFIYQMVKNKKEKPYLLNNKKNEEILPNIYNLKDKNKPNVNEYKRNTIKTPQKNNNIGNPSFHSKRNRNKLENKDNYEIIKIKGKGLILSNNNHKNDINTKDLNYSEKSKKIKNIISEDINDKKERNEKNDSFLEIILDKTNKEIKKEKILKLGDEELKNIKKENLEENDENSKLQRENKNIKESNKQKDKEIEKLKKEKNDLILKNKELNEENEKMIKRINNNDLLLNSKELNKEKENSNNSELINIKKEKIELNNTINNLIEKNEELQKEKEEINNELKKEKEKNKEINNLKLENKELNEKLKEEIQKYNNLNSKNIELNKDNENIKLELIKSIDEKNNLIKEKEKLYEENLKNNKESNDLILKNDKIEKQLNELKLLFEKQNEILIEIKNNNPMALYNKPTLIRLNNIGTTCFMNSIIQCLSQTKELAIYFLRPKNKNEIINNNIALENKNNCQLSPVFLELIQKLWDKDGPKSFYPKKLIKTINEINPLFKNVQIDNAKDFIIFVLEQLHKELKKSVNLNNNSNSESLNRYDKESAFNYYFKNFKNQVSIISELFYGLNETKSECLNCKNNYKNQGLYNNSISYNYIIFNCLIFPLEEVNNFRLNNNKFNNNNCVSIYDCFEYNQKTELFTGENRNYCNICKNLYDSNYTSKIYFCPKVLILILNRGKGNKNVKLIFDEKIDITEFVLQKEKSKIIYNLYGIITYTDQSDSNEYFVASCKSPIDKKWYRYNDSKVSLIENVQKEIIEFEKPYILFYQKKIDK